MQLVIEVTKSVCAFQWREGSYTANGDVYRVYMVCNVAVVADNWLRTPYIPRGDANRLYVDVKFSMRRCTKYPDPTRLQQCKESFKVRFHRAILDFDEPELMIIYLISRLPVLHVIRTVNEKAFVYAFRSPNIPRCKTFEVRGILEIGKEILCHCLFKKSFPVAQ